LTVLRSTTNIYTKNSGKSVNIYTVVRCQMSTSWPSRCPSCDQSLLPCWKVWHDVSGVSFTYSVTDTGIGCECNVNVCVLGSDLMWLQRILMSNSWPSRCPSCDQPLLPCWKVWTWCFWQVFGRDGWGLVARWEFFFHVMVGGDGGVVGPKELVGWVGTVTDVWTYTPPTPHFTEVEAQFFTTCRNILMRLKHSFLPRVEIFWWTLQNLFTTRCFLKEQSVHVHVVRFENFFDKENWKTRPGSGRRTPALQFVENSYGFVGVYYESIKWEVKTRPVYECPVRERFLFFIRFFL
jgi:hypothetical protein